MRERAVTEPTPMEPRNPIRFGSAKILVAGLVVALSLAYLILSGVQSAAVYYVTPGELTAQGAAAYDRPVRVGGRVVDGSIERDDRSLSLRFALSDGSASMPVAYRGVVPDLFGYARDGYYQDVIVEGRYSGDGVFEARQLIVSHGAEMGAAPRSSSLSTSPQKGLVR